jgi:predicted phosphodiesterase
MEQSGADVLCFGHTHKPYHRILASQETEVQQFRHAINIGSVGKPKDGNPQGGYVIITINQDASILAKDAIKVEFIRFDYDVEKAAKAIINSPLPNEFADMLIKGQ